MLTRRELVQRTAMFAGAGLVGETILGLSTCDNIEQDIMNYVPVALTSFDDILTLISPAEATALAPIIADVKVALADIQTAVTNYENATAGTTGLAAKIVAAIQAAEQAMQEFWSTLNLPGSGLASTIESIIQIILSTLMAFVPGLGGSATITRKKAVKRTVTYTPKMRKLKQLKKEINAALVTGHYAPIFK